MTRHETWAKQHAAYAAMVATKGRSDATPGQIAAAEQAFYASLWPDATPPTFAMFERTLAKPKRTRRTVRA